MAKLESGGQLKQIRMGLGEAILRLVHVEVAYASQLGVSDELTAERELIVTALNQYELDLGFDCNDDGVADSVPADKPVEIFQASAATSCCRILPTTPEPSKARRGDTSRSRK